MQQLNFFLALSVAFFALIFLCRHQFSDGEPSRRRLKADPGAVQHLHRHHGSASSAVSCPDMKRWPGLHNGAFITRDDGTWYQRHDGSQQYETATCALKRFTAEEARVCLKSHHILMIGDSIQRYQFLALAQFIETGAWAPRFGIPMDSKDGEDPVCVHKDVFGKPTCSLPDEPSLLSENDFAYIYGHETEKSWKRMHLAIGGKAFNGNMECQCARRDEAFHNAENMFYHNEELGIKLSFISNIGTYPVHWWEPSHCAATSSCNLTSEEWDALARRADAEEWTTSGMLADLLRPDAVTGESKVSALLPDVDIALFNRGAWGQLVEEEGKEVMDGLFALTQLAGKRKGQEGRCYWRSNHPLYSGGPHVGYDLEKVGASIEKVSYQAGCGVFHVSHVTRAFAHYQWGGDMGRNRCCGEEEMLNVYFDAVHLRPWVNEELDNILLNVLC